MSSLTIQSTIESIIMKSLLTSHYFLNNQLKNNLPARANVRIIMPIAARPRKSTIKAALHARDNRSLRGF